MNENIKHLRQIVEHNIPEETPIAEALAVLDMLEADMQVARDRERPEVRGLLHTVVKWLMAGHLVPNDKGFMSLHADKKRKVAAKMGVRLAMGAWLSAASKAIEPHENCAAPLLDTHLGNIAAALSLLQKDNDHTLTLSHGGPGGKWYCRIERAAESLSDGVGDDPVEALNEAVCGMEAHT